MPHFHTATLASLDLAGIAEAFNVVYTDYIVPFRVDADWARRHIAANDIDLDASFLWRSDDGELVGLAALGVRDRRGWVGGFGIAPAYRGRGLSHPLIAATVARAREYGLRRLQLEVITSNARAIRAYEGAGFIRARDLLILAAQPGGITGDAEDAREIAPADALPHLARLAAPVPCWQREAAALIADPELRGLALGAEDAPDACLLYRRGERGVAVQALAGRDAAATGALVAALAARYPAPSLSLGNEPEESPAIPALLAAGWRETMRQHEMICALDEPRVGAGQR